MVIIDWDFADVIFLLSQAGTRWWLPENGMTIDLKYKEKHNWITVKPQRTTAFK
jgi:hypothetical protein